MTSVHPPVASFTTSVHPPVASFTTSVRPPVASFTTSVHPPVASFTTSVRPPVASFTTSVHPPVASFTTSVHPPVASFTTSVHPPVASLTKKVNPRLAKSLLKTNGHLANLEFTSLVKEVTGMSDVWKKLLNLINHSSGIDSIHNVPTCKTKLSQDCVTCVPITNGAGSSTVQALILKLNLLVPSSFVYLWFQTTWLHNSKWLTRSHEICIKSGRVLSISHWLGTYTERSLTLT